jgi:anti-anti-sigma regulatory factor
VEVLNKLLSDAEFQIYLDVVDYIDSFGNKHLVYFQNGYSFIYSDIRDALKDGRMIIEYDPI